MHARGTAPTTSARSLRRAVLVASGVALIVAVAGCGSSTKVDAATRQGAISLRDAMGSASRAVDNVRPTRASLDNLSATLRDASDQTGDVVAVLTARTDRKPAALLLVAAREQRSFLQNAQAAASDHSRSAALASVAKAKAAGQDASDAYAEAATQVPDLAGLLPATTTFATGRLRDAIATAIKPGSSTSGSSKSGGGTTSGGSTSGGTSGSTSGGSSSSSAMTDCGGGVSVNGATSCAFGRNVAEAFTTTGDNPIDVWSPVTDRYYRMSCNGAMPTVCTGGNGARVEIR